MWSLTAEMLHLYTSYHLLSYLTLFSIKVKEPAVEDQTEQVEDTVLRLAQGEESELSQLVDSGSLQSATQLITTMTSMLNAEAEKTEEDVTKQDAKKEKRKQVRCTPLC